MPDKDTIARTTARRALNTAQNVGRSAKQAVQYRSVAGSYDARITPPPFEPLANIATQPITVDPSVRFQRFTGFGAALTESSAYLIKRRLTDDERWTFLHDTFGPGGLSEVRIGIGGTDFNLGPYYSLDPNIDAKLSAAVTAGDTTFSSNWSIPAGSELRIDAENATMSNSELVTTVGAPTGTGPFVHTVSKPFAYGHASGKTVKMTDRNLDLFTINREKSLLIPMLRDILAINPALRIRASVWVPPGWMRTTIDFGSPGKLYDDAYPALAKYIVKFVQAMATEGITIDAVCIQNEPGSPTSSFIYYTPDQYADLLVNHVVPALDTAGLTTKIDVHDYHWAYAAWVTQLFTDHPEILPYVGRVAWHGYAGSPFEQSKIRRKWPTVEHTFSEMRTLNTNPPAPLTPGNYRDWAGIIAGDVLIGSLRNWASSITWWNLALNEEGLPTWYSPGRQGLATIKNDGSGVIKNLEYAVTKRLCAFVQPGAVRCKSSSYSVGHGGDAIQSTAFVNPDESVVVLAYNPTSSAVGTQIIDGRTCQGFPVTLAADEISIFTWGQTPILAGPVATKPVNPIPSTAPTVIGVDKFMGTSQVQKIYSYSYAIPTGYTNNCLLVIVGAGNANNGLVAPIEVTFGGVPMQLVECADTQTGPASSQRNVYVFALLSPPTGSKTVNVLLSKEGLVNVHIMSLSGVNQTQPFGIGKTVVSTSATTLSAIPEQTATDLVVAAACVRGNVALTVTASQNKRGESTQGTLRTAYSTAPGGSGTQSFTMTNADHMALTTFAVRGV